MAKPFDKWMEHTKSKNNHAEEQVRLESNHEIFLYHMGALYFAPIDLSKPGMKIWDSGCANGRWLRDLQASAPATHEYLGTDIDETLYPSPFPAGIRFQNQSILREIPKDWDDRFDFVHQRLVLAISGPTGPRPLVEKLAKAVKPGGWLELVEAQTDPLPENGPAMKQLSRMLHTLLSVMGTGGSYADDLAPSMTKAGLVNVQVKEIAMAFGATQKNESLVNQSITATVLSVGPIAAALKAMPNEFQDKDLDSFPATLQKELEEKGGYLKMNIAWGQKPSG